MNNLIHLKNNPGECLRIHRGLTIPIDWKGINVMAESDSIKKAEKIKFKFCGWCGRLTPLTNQYFNKKSKKHGSRDGFHTFCKKCRNANRRAARAKDPEHYRGYQNKWYQDNPGKPQEYYLKSIGNVAEEIEVRKKIRKIKEIKNRLKQKAVINPKKIKGKMRPADIDIFGNKKCRKCGQWKHNDEENYRWRGDLKKPAFDRICRECDSHRGKKASRNPIVFDMKLFQSLSQYEETRRDPASPDKGQCRCAYCGRWITPTYGATKSRVEAFNKIAFGENRIYCEGDQCREACPTFKQQFYPKGFKVNSSREVDPAIRVMCMERDEWTCQKCGANSPETILHAHHILSYKRNVMLANDLENCLTLCKACHYEVHRKEGCKYHELRC